MTGLHSTSPDPGVVVAWPSHACVTESSWRSCFSSAWARPKNHAAAASAALLRVSASVAPKVMMRGSSITNAFHAV